VKEQFNNFTVKDEKNTLTMSQETGLNLLIRKCEILT